MPGVLIPENAPCNNPPPSPLPDQYGQDNGRQMRMIFMLFATRLRRDPDMPRWRQMFLLYLLSTAGLIASIFLLGDTTLFYEGMTIVGVIVIVNIIVIALEMRNT